MKYPKFVKAADNHYEGQFHRYTTEDKNYDLFIWPVMFGNRIRFGRNGSAWVIVDYCGGDNQNNVQELFSMVKTIIERTPTTEIENIKWPWPYRKPVHLDEKFMAQLKSMAGEFEIEKIPTISIFRAIYLSAINELDERTKQQTNG
jgi:hypothetical protein